MALSEPGRRWSWPELEDRVEKLAGWLAARVPVGGVVAARTANPRRHVEGLLACARAGLVWAPVSPRLSPEAQALVIAAYRPSLALVEGKPALVAVDARVVTPEAWDAAVGDPPPRRSDDSEVVCIIGTGGTTGRSKAACLTHRGLLADARAMIATLGLVPEDVAVHTISMWHLGGLWPLLCHLLVGGGNVLLESADPGPLIEVVAGGKVTGWNAVPVMVRRVLDAPGGDVLSRLKWVGYGGAPMPRAWLVEGFDRWGPILHHVYGLTEASPVVTCLRPEEHDRSRPERLASCGRPLPGVDVRIVDDTGGALGIGAVGEVEVRGDIVMARYWDDPEATAAAFHGEWLRTGDLGVLDSDGYLRVVDRKKDVIITGGLNVYAREVEAVIAEVPGVMDVAVVGYPDDEWGESIAALVVARPGSRLSQDQIRVEVALRLARHARPRLVRFVDELPRTPIGKVDKPAIRRLPWTED